MSLEEVTRELMLETTCQLSSMKIGEINSKYMDYLRNEDYIEKYNLIDFLNGLEYTSKEDVYRKINSKLNDIILDIVEDELDAEILCDELLINLEDILDNYEKSLDDPEYDVDPTYNEYNNTQNQIIEDNKIPVVVLDDENNEVIKFIDKRILEGTIEL